MANIQKKANYGIKNGKKPLKPYKILMKRLTTYTEISSFIEDIAII